MEATDEALLAGTCKEVFVEDGGVDAAAEVEGRVFASGGAVQKLE